MPKIQTISLLILFLISPLTLPAQVVAPQERERDLERLAAVLNHPGERDLGTIDLATDIFFPPFLFEMGPSPRQILRQFSETLSVVAVVRRSGAAPIVRFEGIGLVREGQEVPYELEGETHVIRFLNFSDSSVTLSYQGKTLLIEL